MTSVASVQRDPPLLLSWRFLPFFPHESYFFYFLGVFPDPMLKSWDRDVLTDTFVICDIGLYKMNLIELKK